MLLWGVCKKQQTQITTLETELQGIKEILNTLINAKSFLDFKKSIA
tara:strand:- start:726 stop:863 length:138 start_codon:yes stop_codon:yes gene_type:complete